MRKNHNRLYYGRFHHKTELRLPGSLMFYPTNDSHLLHIKRLYNDATDMNKLADFILENRKEIKFRFQGKKAIFYTDYERSLSLIDNFWEFWTGSETVDPKFAGLRKNMIGCMRLPHGKYKYQVYLKKDTADIMTDNQIETLRNFIESNKDNCLVTSRDVIGLLHSESAYFTGGYFYVTEEKFLTPIYMMAQQAIDKVIQFRKAEHGSNKKVKG